MKSCACTLSGTKACENCSNGPTNLDKMEAARHLLPEPAPQVVGDLIARIRELEKQRNDIHFRWTSQVVLSGEKDARIRELEQAILNADECDYKGVLRIAAEIKTKQWGGK